MNPTGKGLFYLRLSSLLYKFFSESRARDAPLAEERGEFLDGVSETFNYKGKKDVRSVLEELAANLHPEFCRRWRSLVRGELIAPQFTDIFVEGSENLIQEDGEVIAFVSSHRSLYDVPIESMIIFDGIADSPVYSAGSNLAKGPLKYGLQKLGGALIDRELLEQGDRFTTLLTNHYFTCLNLNEFNTLTYLEGTRSRSTAFQEIYSVFLQPPITAQRKKPDLDYKIIPVTVSYDRTPEDLELMRVRKASGRKKTLGEKVAEVTKIHTWAGHDFGNVYVTFCEPIYIGEFVESGMRDSGIRKELKERIEREFKRQYRITLFMLMAHSALNTNWTVTACKTYAKAAERLKANGFNVAIENPRDSFLETLDHPFTKRFLRRTWQDLHIQNKALAEYYAAHVRDVL